MELLSLLDQLAGGRMCSSFFTVAYPLTSQLSSEHAVMEIVGLLFFRFGGSVCASLPSPCSSSNGLNTSSTTTSYIFSPGPSRDGHNLHQRAAAALCCHGRVLLLPTQLDQGRETSSLLLERFPL
ncbi:hypothetical protein LR48_Vigan02g192600 [Vigna angularis]|uniref:Uncharacterized protein n=1 Tax=Phaseolus angularis TaxID=3914 RepID=A0A0L9TZ42_PHAAN|nr:hypothetical protein LR48_Vigan02g192600 [Vigna angularis]